MIDLGGGRHCRHGCLFFILWVNSCSRSRVPSSLFVPSFLPAASAVAETRIEASSSPANRYFCLPAFSTLQDGLLCAHDPKQSNAHGSIYLVPRGKKAAKVSSVSVSCFAQRVGCGQSIHLSSPKPHPNNDRSRFQHHLSDTPLLTTPPPPPTCVAPPSSAPSLK